MVVLKTNLSITNEDFGGNRLYFYGPIMERIIFTYDFTFRLECRACYQPMVRTTIVYEKSGAR